MSNTQWNAHILQKPGDFKACLFHTEAGICRLISPGDQSECLKSKAHYNFAAPVPMTPPRCSGTE